MAKATTMTAAASAKPKAKTNNVSAPVGNDPRRFVSQSTLAEILQRNRTAIREWTSAGMPA